MFRLSTQRGVCLTCRLSSRSQQLSRQVSTSSAINRGIRATQDDGGSKRGGRDRSKRPVARPRRLSDTYTVQSGASRDQRSQRTSFSRRDEGEDRRQTRSSHFGCQRDRRSSKPSFSRGDDAGDSRPNRSWRSGDSRPKRISRSSFSRREDDARDSRPDRSLQRDAGRQQKPRVTRSNGGAATPVRQTHRESDDGPKQQQGGLLREIKSACKLVQKIQELEGRGEEVDPMIPGLKRYLSSINAFAQSGTFNEEPPDAVASILRKHAAEGTFMKGERQSSPRTMIWQRPSGEFAVYVGRGVPSDEHSEKPSSAAGRKSQYETREERPERRSCSDASTSRHTPQESRFERPDKRSWSDAPSSGRRREVSANREVDEDDDIPLPLPYTTAASEFLYGYNTVLAALRAKRRKMYKLYIHPKIFDREGGFDRGQGGKPANEFVTLAKAAGVPFRNEFKTALLDRMSDGRPHNGILLEASKLPTPPVLSLWKPNARDSTMPLTLAQQSAEDAEINGTSEEINSVFNSWRHPFVVLLDGITDPGNLGNIIRSCHFYGVDAVAVATNTCANLSSAVLAKASSGACEGVRLLALPQPSNFVYESARNGWKIYASVAPTPDVASQSMHLTTGSVAAASPLATHPCILMLGAEGEGLRENLRNRANATVSIERGKKIRGTPNVGVDSINVSVAAGVLMDAFLRKPADAPEKRDTSGDLGW